MLKNSRAEREFLFQLVKPYKSTIAFVLFTSILGSAFDGISIGLLFPLLNSLQGINDHGQLPPAFQKALSFLQSYPLNQQIYIIVGFVAFAVLLKNLFLSASVRAGHWLTSRLTADLRLQGTDLLLGVGIDFHHQSKLGTLIDKWENNTAYVETFVRMAMEFIVNSATFFALFVMMLLLSWQLTLFVFLFGIFGTLIVNAYIKTLAKSGEDVADSHRDMLGAMYECLSGIHLIKSYSQEPQHAKLLREHIEINQKLSLRHNFKNYLIHPITDVLGTVGISILIGLMMLVNQADTRIMLAQLLPFMYVVLRLIPLAKILNSQRGEIVGRWCYVGLVQDFLRLDDKPFIVDGTQTFEKLESGIVFRDVTFAYQAECEPVLSKANFEITAGKTTVFVGESGAGKSTILQLLLRLYDPTHGEIRLDGKPLPDFRMESFHRHIGVVSQETFLFNNTIRYNITMGVDDVSDERVIEAARKAGASDFIEALPQSYATLIGDRGVRLSGGQRQRIAIARALIREPEILIFDEATNALDTANEAWIHQEIAKFGQGKTVIIVTHRLSAANNADQVLRVANGKVSKLESPA